MNVSRNENTALHEEVILEEQMDEQPEAAVVETEVSEGTNVETMGVAGDVVGDTLVKKATNTPIAEDIYVPSYELRTFLERPVRIAYYSVPQGEAFNARTIRPWWLYLNTTAIKKKLDNYAYLRGNLHVKIMVNSTQFIYGCYMASYLPMPNFTGHLNYCSSATWNTDWSTRTPLSQRPNVLIRSVGNEGAEMELPFFWHKNWLEVTSAQDTKDLGLLDIVPMVPFRSASTAISPVTITVFAWMTDVKLAGQTITLAQQSGEYSLGPISRPASIVAEVGKRLSNVPIIGKFAKATDYAGTAVAKIASLFGFTNVPVIGNSEPVKNMMFHSLASSQIAGPIDKLTLDPKCELTIDPSSVGLHGEDELAIQNLTGKWSLLCNTIWKSTDAVDTVLFSANVTPTMTTLNNKGVGLDATLDTPMGFVARLFDNWRGDIEYKIVIVPSAFHQGRLRVSFDPLGNPATADSTTVIQTEMVDLQEAQECTFTVPYMAPTSWLRVRNTAVTDYATLGDAAAYSNVYCNGRFDIRVLNALTSPTGTADVEIMVFVRGKETLEFANPSQLGFDSSIFQQQSGEIVLGKTTPAPEQRYLENFGEQIASLRQLMRRHTYVSRFSASVGGAALGMQYTWRVRLGIFPPEYGFESTGLWTANKVIGVGTAKANFTPQSAYTWIAPAFVGQRGSMHYAVHAFGDPMKDLRVTRATQPNAAVTDVSFYQTTTQANPIFNYSGVSGLSKTDGVVQPGLQFSVPFVSVYKFASTDPANRVLGTNLDQTANMGALIERGVVATTAAFSHVNEIEVLAGVGTDFNVFNFVCVPIRWRYTLTPI